MENSEHFDRQVAMFGENGQHSIGKANIAIVGVGGTGSHVAQQLALLGVGSISLIDPDLVEETNLNRLIGSRRDGSITGCPKVNIAKALVKSIEPSLHITTIQKDLRAQESFSAIKNSTHVFGCVDNDGARLVLTELCVAYEIPYFDLASEIIPGKRAEYGGRVFITTNNSGCLYCYGEIDAEEAQQFLRSEGARANLDNVYGVEQQALKSSGPSVVTLNGIIASIATTEFMLMVTGLRNPNRFLRYKGSFGVVNSATDPPAIDDCFYCHSVRGRKEEANIERYIR